MTRKQLLAKIDILLMIIFILFSLQANISQEEYFTKYKEYLNKVNSRKKRSTKLYGDDITRTVFDDDDEDSETFRKIFTFQYSSE